MFVDGDDYEQWKRDVSLWREIIDIPKKKVAIAIHLSLTGKARQASSRLQADELKGVNGVHNLLRKILIGNILMHTSHLKIFNENPIHRLMMT